MFEAFEEEWMGLDEGEVYIFRQDGSSCRPAT
jgi:hypothetical protein